MYFFHPVQRIEEKTAVGVAAFGYALRLKKCILLQIRFLRPIC